MLRECFVFLTMQGAIDAICGLTKSAHQYEASERSLASELTPGYRKARGTFRL